MPVKEADKVRAQVLALLDRTAVEQWIAANRVEHAKDYPQAFGAALVREYAEYLRRQISQGATDSTFAIS